MTDNKGRDYRTVGKFDGRIESMNLEFYWLSLGEDESTIINEMEMIE